MMDMDELFEHLEEAGLKPIYIDENSGWLLKPIEDEEESNGS